ncbi:MAG: glycosyltransferase [Verrucomicrobia bacterium]|nr:glycosyltransferase [Verrucomicrobiota bacterium]
MNPELITQDEMLLIPATEISDLIKLEANPLVSVIMLAYNHQRFIAEAIEGILKQKCSFAFEVLIGEDCSADGTRGICLSYQRRYPQLIRLITAEKNVGGSRNFFRLCARARGRYLAFCEGDDYWCDEYKLEKQGRMFDSQPGMSLCFSRCGVCREDQADLITEWYPRREAVRYEVEDFISTRVMANACTVCVKREVVSCLPKFMADSAIGDWPFFVLALLEGHAGYIPERLGVYRIHAKGAWASATAERRYEGFKAINRLLRMYVGSRYYRCFDTSLAKAYFQYAERSCVGSGRYGFFAVMSSLKRCPVPVWRAGRTLIAFLLHVGFPKIYAGLLAANVIKRMQH